MLYKLHNFCALFYTLYYPKIVSSWITSLYFYSTLLLNTSANTVCNSMYHKFELKTQPFYLSSNLTGFFPYG